MPLPLQKGGKGGGNVEIEDFAIIKANIIGFYNANMMNICAVSTRRNITTG